MHFNLTLTLTLTDRSLSSQHMCLQGRILVWLRGVCWKEQLTDLNTYFMTFQRGYTNLTKKKVALTSTVSRTEKHSFLSADMSGCGHRGSSKTCLLRVTVTMATTLCFWRQPQPASVGDRERWYSDICAANAKRRLRCLLNLGTNSQHCVSFLRSFSL